MSEIVELSKECWGKTIMTMYHVLNKVPTGNEEIAPFKEWEKKILIFLTHKYEVVWTNRMCESTRRKIFR